MKLPSHLRALCSAIGLALLLASPLSLLAAAPDLTVTDLTTINRTQTYNLGPTGMRGWIYHAWSATADQDGITAFAPYQILVTTVAAGTPAAGVLQVDDVILGASAGSGSVPLFTSDARKSLGWAIGAAEAVNGVLSLKRWRAGVTTDVSIDVTPATGIDLGAYSNTAPYTCPKTTRIMNAAAHRLKLKIDANGWGGNDGRGAISALALLATGDPAYLPIVQAYARSLAPQNLDLETTGLSAWNCYNSIFLAEYYMLTNDAQVFHGLSEYVIYAATHSSMFGTAGHGFSNVPPPGGWQAGGTHGSMSWYGPVNSAGLAAQLSIALGKKAGVVSPEIDPAIERAAKFFGYYVNRGSIPYGEHQPYFGEHQIQGQTRTYYDHASNGKDALAAVMFSCIDNKPVQTEYFARMSLSGYKGEHYGHTGQGFSYLWTMLGANVGGPLAVAEYQKKMRWDRDMKRRYDGSFVYEGGEQWGTGQGSDYWDDSYTYWGYPTAYYVLHAAIPLKNLYITGKNANPANELGAQAVASAIAAAEFSGLCGGSTKEQLFTALGDWDPIVRFNAATELATRSPTPTEVNSLIAMAENPTDANQREAACTALGCLKATSAIPALTRRLSDSDIWVRAKAAKALGQGNAAAVASSVPVMLGTFVTNVAPTYPFEPGFNWDDPLQIANGYLSETLFENLGTYTISADKSLLYPAVRAGIKQPAGMWRGKLDAFVQNRLTLSDVEVLIEDLLEDARTEGPADRMFTVTPPAAAMNVLAKYHIQEGIQACFDNVAYWGGVLGATAINRLADYGEAARWTLPDLYADLSWWKHDNNYNALVNTVAALEAATTSPTLVRLLPVANPQVVVTPTNTARAITLTGSSPRAGALSHRVATHPAHGYLAGTAPNLTYIPAGNYQGTDRFTFTVTDSLTESSPATVNVVMGPGGTGLTGSYFDNMDFTSLMATRTEPAVNFDWGTTPPNPLGAGPYSVRWTGQVMAPESGTYRFSTRTSDGVRLWVNGVQVINDWNDQVTNVWNDSAAITLTAGQKYSLRMDYYNNANPATVRLYWSMPSRQAASIISQELLFPNSVVSLTSPLDGARFGQATTVTLTADPADMAGPVTNVSFYHGDTLIGSDTTAPYSVAWENVAVGEYRLTARAADSTGQVSTSSVSVITVDSYSIPVRSGLACHFDAAVGITTDVNGVVQGWQDRSGNGHHATLGSGVPSLATNQIMAQPAVQMRGNATWFNIAGGFFAKEQYVVVRSPNATWNGSGSFLGRKSDDFLTARASSYNLASGSDGFWQDHFPQAVSRNGLPLAQNSQNGSAFHLAPITDYMVVKITVDGQASAANLAAYPYNQIGRNETLGTMDFDVAEIIGYTNTLSAGDEALVGGYLAAKYGIATTYPATGSLATLSASGITTNSATINATLKCNGGNYEVVAYWGPVKGGTNPANWANSASIGSWNNGASINLSRTLTGFAPATTCYFTFRATSAANTVWAAAPQSFTTISTAKDILTFGTNVAGSSAVINGASGTVVWTVPNGTPLTNQAPAFTISPMASASPVSGIHRDFSTSQTYTVTAQDGSTKVHTVTVSVGAPSGDCDILSFSPGAVIDGTNIALTVPYETNLANFAPLYTVSPGASGVPASGVAPTPNFAIASPVAYIMTAPDGITTKTYHVTITVLPFNPPAIPNVTTVGDWSFLNSQNPGWTRARTTTLTANGIQLGTAGVGEGMMSVAKPAALSFINSGVEMTFNGSNTVGNNAGYAYISMFRDAGNPPRNAYGITATNFTASGGRLTTSINNGTTGGEIMTSTPLVNALFVGRHTMALVRFDDNTLKAYLDGVEIGSRTTTAPSLTLGFIGVGSNYFGGSTYLPLDTIVERVRAFTFPSGGFSPSGLLVLPSAAVASAGNSSVVASPIIVANNGLATSTIAVTLKDIGGNPLAGKSVTLVSSRGATDTLSTNSSTTNASGVAAFTAKSSTAGSSVFTATDTTDTVTVAQTATVTFSALAPTTITLVRHPGTGTTSTYGTALSFDVTVSGGSGTPTGVVTLKDGGPNGTTLGSATFTGGSRTLTTPSLVVGTHANIVAVYSGNSSYATSTSSALSTQNVISPSATILASSEGTAGVYGTAVNFVAMVDAAGAPATGTVIFMEGATVLGTGTLSAGQATLTISALTAGAHAITAQYEGDASTSASAAGAFGYTVNAQPLTIAGVTANDKIYDGTTIATLTGGTVFGVLAGETVSLVPGTGAFADANAGTGKTVTAGGYSFSGVHGGNYAPVQPTGLAASITARPIQPTGTRVYDGTVAAGTLTIANNLDGGNLSLTGTAFLAGKNVGSQPVMTSTAVASRVRSAKGSTGANAASTISVTMGGTPAAGHTMIAVIATRGTTAGGNIVTSITQTGIPNGTWVRAAEAHNTSMTTEIWYASNLPAGAGTAVTINQASFLSAAVVMEYSGILTAVPLDQIALGNSVGTSLDAVTGTTATTTQANELWIGGIGYAHSTRTLGTILNSFTSVDNAVTSNATSGNNAMVYAIERIVSAAGAASSGGTISSSATQWAGTIAAFKASNSILALAGSAAANYTLAGANGSVTVTPKALALSGQTAGNKVYDGTTVATLTGTRGLPAAEAAGSGTSNDGKPYTGDTVGLGGTTVGAFADKHAGIAKPVTVTGATLVGAQAGNYTLTPPVGLSGNITPLPITVTAVTATKFYDGTTAASGTPTLSPVLAAGDTSTVLAQAFQDASVGVGNKVIVPSITINDGNGGANYAATPFNFLTGTINPLGTIADWRPGHFSPAEITAGLAAAGADPDGDGVINSDEYTLGTDPRTSNQQPLTIRRSGNNCTQTFVARSATGSGSAGLTRKYDLLVSSDIKTPGSWADVSGYTDTVGADQTITVTVPIALPNKYYRLRVRLE